MVGVYDSGKREAGAGEGCVAGADGGAKCGALTGRDAFAVLRNGAIEVYDLPPVEAPQQKATDVAAKKKKSNGRERPPAVRKPAMARLMRRKHGAGAVQHGALRGIVFRRRAEGFLQILGAHRALEVEDVAGADQLSISAGRRNKVSTAPPPKVTLVPKMLLCLLTEPPDFQRLEPKHVLPGRGWRRLAPLPVSPFVSRLHPRRGPAAR